MTFKVPGLPRQLTQSGDSAHDLDWLGSGSGRLTGCSERILP
jgi:hypothetical protein